MEGAWRILIDDQQPQESEWIIHLNEGGAIVDSDGVAGTYRVEEDVLHFDLPGVARGSVQRSSGMGSIDIGPEGDVLTTTLILIPA